MGGLSVDESEPDVGQLAERLQAARCGTDSELGHLLETTRRYLLLVANHSLDSQLSQKVAPSDLVQETLIDAHRDFAKFEGTNEAEFFAWLRQILLHKASHVRARYRGTVKRDLNRELRLSGPGQLASLEPSPSALVMNQEKQSRLTLALEQLPEHYRQVIELRSFDRLAFAEIARRMGRSEDAVGKLWCRAIEDLRKQMLALGESRLF